MLKKKSAPASGNRSVGSNLFEPLLCSSDVGLGETVARRMGVKRDVGAASPKVSG
jgi:hypothetical protein